MAFSTRDRTPIAGHYTSCAAGISKDPLINLKAGSELCLSNEGLFGRAGRRRAAIPFDVKIRKRASSPIFTNLDCPTKDQGRMGGRKIYR